MIPETIVTGSPVNVNSMLGLGPVGERYVKRDEG
jgi:hypothetical protein